jgi:uncharacterized protein
MRSFTHLGRGWGHPVRPLTGRGALAYADGAGKVEQSIWLILDTEPGERLMRPTFGCGLRRHLMEPNTPATRALIQREVTLALTTWEPRVQLRSVRVEPGEDPALVLVSVEYVLVRDGRGGTLVYPFYLDA